MDDMTAYAMNMANSWAQAEYANKNTKELQQNSFAQQNKILDQTQQYNLDLWNRSNAYNSPSAQMDRLKAAGINPNMAFMQGSLNNTTQQVQGASAPSAASGQGIAPQADQVGWLNYAISRKQLEIENKKLDIENKKADSLIGLQGAQTEQLQQSVDQQDIRFNYELNKMASETNLDNATVEKIQTEMDVNRAKLDEINSQIALNKAASNHYNWQVMRGKAFASAELQKLDYESQYLVKQMWLMEAQEGESRSRITLNGVEGELVKAKTGQINFEVDWDKEHKTTAQYFQNAAIAMGIWRNACESGLSLFNTVAKFIK